MVILLWLEYQKKIRKKAQYLIFLRRKEIGLHLKS